ncbi:hypothetical protein MHYP_G00182540 [Metynnis hypsauchen]
MIMSCSHQRPRPALMGHRRSSESSESSSYSLSLFSGREVSDGFSSKEINIRGRSFVSTVCERALRSNADPPAAPARAHLQRERSADHSRAAGQREQQRSSRRVHRGQNEGRAGVQVLARVGASSPSPCSSSAAVRERCQCARGTQTPCTGGNF